MRGQRDRYSCRSSIVQSGTGPKLCPAMHIYVYKSLPLDLHVPPLLLFWHISPSQPPMDRRTDSRVLGAQQRECRAALHQTESSSSCCSTGAMCVGGSFCPISPSQGPCRSRYTDWEAALRESHSVRRSQARWYQKDHNWAKLGLQDAEPGPRMGAKHACRSGWASLGNVRRTNQRLRNSPPMDCVSHLF